MQKALELAPGLAVIEAIFVVLWILLMVHSQRRDPGSEPFDDGPWWSVWFFRVWAACHLPVMLFQAGIHALFRKQEFKVPMPLFVGAFLLHAINLALVLLLVSVG